MGVLLRPEYSNFPLIMYIVIRNTAFALLLLGSSAVQAQDTWSLERCVTYALDHNLTVKQAQANVKLSLLSQQQAKAARLPSVSGTANAGKQFGRTIDPTSNQFNTQSTGYNSLGLNAGITLFSGGQILHNIKQTGWSAEASVADAEQTGNNLALQVASAYLTVLLDQEQLTSAHGRVTQSQQQLSNTLKLVNAGTVPMGDRYNIDAQIARNQQLEVVAQNSLDLAYLSLKQLLQLEPDFDLRVDRPEVLIPADANPDGLSLPPVYNIALNTQPSIKATDFRIRSAEEGISVAKAAYYPTLSLFANLSSNYSTQLLHYAPSGQTLSDPQTIYVNGTPVTVNYPVQQYTTSKISYGDQINQNFGQGVGFSLSIPIYQNGRIHLGVERARLSLLNAQIQSNQTRQQLKNDIQTAIANARSARKQLEAAQKSAEANRIAFSNTEKRHTLGSVNSLELTTAKNNLDIAESDLIVAKYDYLFKLKILDFYQGKPLVMK
jgi:outer membrane protein